MHFGTNAPVVGQRDCFASLRLITAVLLLLVPTQISAQHSTSTSVIFRVSDHATGLPLAGAHIAIAGTAHAGATNREGHLRLNGVATGEYVIVITAASYTAERIRLELVPTDSAEIDIALLPDPIRVPAVAGSAERRNAGLRATGFYQRAETFPGHFLTKEQFRGRRLLSDVLAMVPGVRVVAHARYLPGSRRIEFLANQGLRLKTFRSPVQTTVEPCPVRYYLDGTPYELGVTGIDELNLGIVEAVEVYRAGARVPAEFNTDAMCGVVLIWTRRG